MIQFIITFTAVSAALIADRLLSMAVAGIAMWRFNRLVKAAKKAPAPRWPTPVNPRRSDKRIN